MGFSDLVDLWVVKIKKSMILCARSTWRSSEQAKRIENASAKRIMQREREKFVYSLVKITRLTDYQTWRTHSRGAQRHVGFFLDCALRMLIGWADKFRSHGSI